LQIGLEKPLIEFSQNHLINFYHNHQIYNKWGNQDIKSIIRFFFFFFIMKTFVLILLTNMSKEIKKKSFGLNGNKSVIFQHFFLQQHQFIISFDDLYFF
jgi:hypothetical protein